MAGVKKSAGDNWVRLTGAALDARDDLRRFMSVTVGVIDPAYVFPNTRPTATVLDITGNATGGGSASLASNCPAFHAV